MGGTADASAGRLWGGGGYQWPAVAHSAKNFPAVHHERVLTIYGEVAHCPGTLRLKVQVRRGGSFEYRDQPALSHYLDFAFV